MTQVNPGPYKVEPLKVGTATKWVVRCPGGHIANEHHHPTRDSAERHADLCNVFWRAWRDNPVGETRHA